MGTVGTRDMSACKWVGHNWGSMCYLTVAHYTPQIGLGNPEGPSVVNFWTFEGCQHAGCGPHQKSQLLGFVPNWVQNVETHTHTHTHFPTASNG